MLRRMDRVTTDAAFSHRKPLYSFKNAHTNNSVDEKITLSSEDGFIKTTAEGPLRRNKPTRKSSDSTTTRRLRHSAPDLSFGGTIDLSRLELHGHNDLRNFNERPLKPLVRRPSLGTELEHIVEDEEGSSDHETGQDNSLQDGLSNSERLLAVPIRLPPIFENQGYKPQRRDFRQRPSNDNTMEVSDAVQYRYVRNRPENRRRKLSM